MTSRLPPDVVQVLDPSRVLAGSTCGMVLGDFGAEVIEVEHPGRGDDTRDRGLRVGRTETAYFNSEVLGLAPERLAELRARGVVRRGLAAARAAAHPPDFPVPASAPPPGGRITAFLRTLPTP